MADENDESTDEKQAEQSVKRYSLGYYLKRTMIYFLSIYFLLCLAVYVFQKKLIYHPRPMTDSESEYFTSLPKGSTIRINSTSALD